jgi:hypothetical protein
MLVLSLSFGATHNVNKITSLTASLLQGLRREGKRGKTRGNLDPAGMRGTGQREQDNTGQRCLRAQQTGTVQTEAIMIGFVMGHVGSIGYTKKS